MRSANLRSRCLNLSVLFTAACLAIVFMCSTFLGTLNLPEAQAATINDGAPRFDCVADAPDLTGSWKSVSYGLKGSLTGKLSVSNIGKRKAKQFQMAFYYSKDGVSKGERISKTITVCDLEARQTKVFCFNFSAPKSPSNKYILAVLGCQGKVAETNESNNSIAALLPRSHCPVANAGPDQTVRTGETVTLDGSASSDPDGGRLRYKWAFNTIPPGSKAVLSNAQSVNPTFTVDVAGTYVVSLIVSDCYSSSSPDTVMITTTNSPPVANAGPDQTVSRGAAVSLDGSKSSDVDGDALTYFWAFSSVPAGSAAALDDPSSVNTSFRADRAGTTWSASP
jgi:hypothetical protein